ncbi:hypothetical protein [Salinicola halophilus]|uniref:hypothetical protein n=1 Tax=Salinicola halophilus TaxID=184065 RepID=UPI000DA1C5CF|nr:hypothetical protein [Salinicola halophilus]
MHRNALPDRRYKHDDELQLHLVKPRFTESEIAAVEAEAAMSHGGKLAALVREATMLGIEAMRQRRSDLLARLQAGESLPPDESESLEAALAALASQNIAANRSVAQQNTA